MSSRLGFFLKWLAILTLAFTIIVSFRLTFFQNGRSDERQYAARHNPKFAVTRERDTVDLSLHRELSMSTTPVLESTGAPSIHIFYYPWYGNPEYDNGLYYHWNHRFLPHWNKSVASKYPSGMHTPPKDLASTFYPLLGPYSSRDPAVIEQHMKWMSAAGIDVVVISWFPPHIADKQGHPWDDLILVFLNAAEKHRMKVSFHMEPYENRSAESLRSDVEHIIKNYGQHPALYKTTKTGNNSKELPLLYFYDSYLLDASEWKKLTTVRGSLSVRNGPYDVLFIGLLVDSEDRHTLLQSAFDGMYTYFASEKFSFGSTIGNWPSLSAFCRKNGMKFIPSVGPGYDDRRVRPWNMENVRDREDGEYYKKMFEMAHNSRASIVSITSFNEWHEGTQIEPAIPFVDNETGYSYANYEHGPEQYLHLTLDLIKKYFTPLNKIGREKIVAIV